MKKKIRKFIGIGFLISLLMITGCWDSKEIENLAVTTLIAWDRVIMDGEELWQISTRILDMTQHQSGEGGGATSARELLLVGRGVTTQDAFNELLRRLPASHFLEHNVAFIIGERVAKEELSYIMNSALRFQRSRIRVDVFIVQGEAYQILQAEPELSSTLSKEVRKVADRTAEQSGVSLKVKLLDFSKQLIRTDRDAVLPLISIYSKKEGEVTPEKSVKIEGFGVIRESKLVGWLEGEDAKAYILSVGNPQNPEIPLALKYEDMQISYFITNAKGKVSAELVGGKPKYTISVKTEGIIYEAGTPALNSEERRPLEKAIEERIMEMVWQCVNKAREYDADIFGFNEHLHRYHLRDWQTIEPNWRRTFQEAEVEVKVDATIRSFGTSNKGFNF